MVVSVDGRRDRDDRGARGQASGSGLRLELEPEWLRPGRYMIQVTTAEKTPLHLRRYVIEVQSSPARRAGRRRRADAAASRSPSIAAAQAG